MAGKQAAGVLECAKKKGPRFFKVFFPGLCSKQLEISLSFRKHIQRVPPGSTCLLRGPSGRAWRVDMVKNEKGRVFFREGWEEFVGDHSLQTGEFLVFEYEGRLRFRVMVFDASLCEKWSAFDAAPSAPRCSVGCVEGSGRRRGRRKKGEPVSSDSSKNTAAAAPAPAAAAPAREGGAGDSPAGRCAPREGALWKPQDRKRYVGRAWISQRRPVTQEEVRQTRQAASSFKSTNPTLLLVMRKYDVYYGHMRRVPLSFSRRHLSDNKKMTFWDPTGKPWTVNYISCNGRHFFSGGWRKFALGNSLEQDDVCVFELVGPDDLRVHVFRVVEETRPLIRKVGS